MQQVLDFFDLLADSNNDNVVWNLIFATTNSPFTAEGAPVDLRTNAGAYGAISAHLEKIQRGMSRVVSGDEWESDFPIEKREVATRILKRNANGIGRTKILFGDETKSLQISKENAERALDILEHNGDTLHAYLFESFARRELGAVDGRIVDLGTDYEEPGLRLREHKSGREFWCRIDHRAKEQIERTLTAGDVWSHRRVRIRGILNYDHTGKIVRVYDGTVTFIPEPEATLDSIYDPEFTEGYSVAEYLERLRENDFA